jgi:flagellar basal-body rod modification protein FlgD
MIDAIDTRASAAAQLAEEQAASALGANETVDQQQFLTLFITQLQNQDPLNPLDVNGLTSQLAQFSSLEQLYGINSALKDLGEAMSSREQIDPVSLLGADVTVGGDTIELAGGEATTLVLDVPPGASGVQIAIEAPGGGTVRTVDLGAAPGGDLEFVFDGRDDRGLQVPDGLYTARIAARDEAGEPLSVESFVQGTVTGVDLRGESPVLLLGERRVALGEIRAIRAPEGEAGAAAEG